VSVLFLLPEAMGLDAETDINVCHPEKNKEHVGPIRRALQHAQAG
jgi:hypothetical protein